MSISEGSWEGGGGLEGVLSLFTSLVSFSSYPRIALIDNGQEAWITMVLLFVVQYDNASWFCFCRVHFQSSALDACSEWNIVNVVIIYTIGSCGFFLEGQIFFVFQKINLKNKLENFEFSWVLLV